MLAEARSRIVRYTPAEAAAAHDILLVDVRAQPLGRILGSKHFPRSVLEWRADPTSEWRDPELVGRRLVIVCDEGYSSSLAAATLVDLGVDAGDLDGGFDAWVAEGLPVE